MISDIFKSSLMTEHCEVPILRKTPGLKQAGLTDREGKLFLDLFLIKTLISERSSYNLITGKIAIKNINLSLDLWL